MELTDAQSRALAEITKAQTAFMADRRHLLTGYAGSGKTTLMQHVAGAFHKKKLDIVVTAPTHKAVSVLAKKMADAKLGHIPCATIHSLLSLRPIARGSKTALKRTNYAKAITVDVVIIDECSMVSEELLGWIDQLMPHVFVLYVGDPAQLPPVNEGESRTFATASRSHLDTIVRQAEGNPILDAAHAIRRSQGGPLDWSWCQDVRAEKQGVFIPADVKSWMRQAFTSDKFKADNDQFRYLCWRNERVAEVNSMIRSWIYGGPTPTPFMPQERVLLRAPVMVDDTVIIATNDEAEVVSIEPDVFDYSFVRRGAFDSWSGSIPSWRMELLNEAGCTVSVHIPRNPDDLANIDGRLIQEAKMNGARWQDRFEFAKALAQMQPVYAMTVHTAQGSTFGHAFVDVADIRLRARQNLLETQQLLYVAATRPSQALILSGARAAA